MLRCWELHHVSTDLGDHAVGGDLVHSRDRHQQFDLVLKRQTTFHDLLVKFRNFDIKKSTLIKQFSHLKTMPLFKMAGESQTQLRNFVAQLGSRHLREPLWLCDSVHHRSQHTQPRLAQDMACNRSEFDVDILENLLYPIRNSGPLLHNNRSIAIQIAQFAHLLGGAQNFLSAGRAEVTLRSIRSL